MVKKFFISLLFLLMLNGCGLTPFGEIMSVSDINNLPKFVKNDFVNLNMIDKISKFRSGAGHDFSDGFESNRSMKHYYNPYVKYCGDDHTVKVFSPVDGVISTIWKEEDGRKNDWQIHIVPTGYSYVTIRLFHINTHAKVGDYVRAGQFLGFANMSPTPMDSAHGATYSPSFDIAVEVVTRNGVHLVSYFEIMTDSLFSTYQTRGLTDRSELIISKEWRDTHPVDWNNPQESDWVVLSPVIP